MFDYLFQKKGSGGWMEWMDTVDKASMAIADNAKVRLDFTCLSIYNMMLPWLLGIDNTKVLFTSKCISVHL